MSDLKDLYEFATIELWLLAGIAVILPALYAILSHGRWTRTPLGRSIMSVKAVLALLLAVTLWGIYHPQYPRILLGASIVLYGYGILTLGERTVLLLRAYYKGSDDDRERLFMADTPRTKPQPILVFMSVLVALDVIVAGAALGNLLKPDLVGFLLLIMAGLKMGSAYYIRGQVVPLSDVGAFVNDERQMVAGPASVVPDDEPVTVAEVEADAQR